MPTLALPMRPVKQARTLAYGLALACTTLAPLPGNAFTYDKYQTKSFLAQCRSYTSSMLNSFAWLIPHDLMR